MPALIFPDRWRRKPDRPVHLDWSHPLAAGLAFYAIDVGGTYRSLLRSDVGKRLGTIGYGGSNDPRVGGGAAFGGAGSVFFSQDDHPEVQISGKIAFGCGLVWTGTYTSDPVPFGRTARNGASEPYFNYIIATYNTQWVAAAAFDTGRANPGLLGALVSGQYHTLIGTYAPGGPLKQYQDGVFLGQTDNKTTLANVTTNADIIFSGASSAGVVSPFGGMVPWGAVWTRELSADEQTLLHREPYALLRPLSSRRLYSVAGGAGTSVEALPTTGSVSVSGLAPTVGVGVTASPSAGSVSVQGYAPTASAGVAASPGCGSVAVEGYAPTVGVGVTAAPSVGGIAVQGYAPDFSASVEASPGAGSVSVDGYAPTATAENPDATATPGTGSVSVVGFAPVVVAESALLVRGAPALPDYETLRLLRLRKRKEKLEEQEEDTREQAQEVAAVVPDTGAEKRRLAARERRIQARIREIEAEIRHIEEMIAEEEEEFFLLAA